QSGGGGGITRQSSDRTTVQPFIGGSISVTVPMDNPMVPFVDVVASASWSPAPDDFYFSGPDSFGQTISDRLKQDDEFALNLTVRVPISDGGLTASDARLKRDIRLVAALSEGINLYSYRYLGQQNRRVGVIAQEVVQVMPWAVQRHRSGFFMVDYSAVFADPSLQKALVGSGYELDL
ncbi:MAG: tail fiber domain-containing protein, partial [Hyphomicrobiales bacterium]